jgi:hypothetical protein
MPGAISPSAGKRHARSGKQDACQVTPSKTRARSGKQDACQVAPNKTPSKTRARSGKQDACQAGQARRVPGDAKQAPCQAGQARRAPSRSMTPSSQAAMVRCSMARVKAAAGAPYTPTHRIHPYSVAPYSPYALYAVRVSFPHCTAFPRCLWRVYGTVVSESPRREKPALRLDHTAERPLETLIWHVSCFLHHRGASIWHVSCFLASPGTILAFWCAAASRTSQRMSVAWQHVGGMAACRQHGSMSGPRSTNTRRARVRAPAFARLRPRSKTRASSMLPAVTYVTSSRRRLWYNGVQQR